MFIYQLVTTEVNLHEDLLTRSHDYGSLRNAISRAKRIARRTDIDGVGEWSIPRREGPFPSVIKIKIVEQERVPKVLIDRLKVGDQVFDDGQWHTIASFGERQELSRPDYLDWPSFTTVQKWIITESGTRISKNMFPCRADDINPERDLLLDEILERGLLTKSDFIGVYYCPRKPHQIWSNISAECARAQQSLLQPA